MTLDRDTEWIAPYTQRIRRHIRGSGRILELGCGTGRDTVELVRLGEVVGIDLSEPRLRECHKNAPQAMLIRSDLSRRLPVRPATFSVVVASLCLHYFSWEISLQVAAEIRRAMTLGGLLIVRVNSTQDANHGAVGYPKIEANFYNVDGYPKRFFDRQSALKLFRGWEIEAIEERAIMRYEKPKWIWELSLYAT